MSEPVRVCAFDAVIFDLDGVLLDSEPIYLGATNAVLGTQGNRDLFLNALNWVAQQENLIAIRPKQAGDRRVTMTEDQQRRVLYLSVLGLPLAVAALGIWTWNRRRG